MTDCKQELTDFAAVLFEPDDLIEVRLLPTKRGEGPQPLSLWMAAGDLPERHEQLQKHSDDGLNLYVGVMPRTKNGGSKDKDCKPGQVAWADFDDTDARTAWQHTIDCNMPKPTMAVNSGHGAHIYWRLTEKAAPDILAPLVRGIAVVLGSDTSVANPSRILRLPGFQNHKEPPAMAEYVWGDPSITVDFATLRSIVDTAMPPQTDTDLPPADMDLPPHITADDQTIVRARKYIAAVEGSGPGGRTHTAYRVAATLTNDFGLSDADALPLLEGWDQAVNRPPIQSDSTYRPNELSQIIRNAHQYAKGQHGSKAQSIIPARADVPDVLRAPDPSPLDDMHSDLEAQARGEREAIALPWPRLSAMSKALQPGTLALIVGPTGSGKSYMAMNVAKAVHDAGETWGYLPLEDRRLDFKWRMLAVLTGEYTMADTDAAGAQRRGAALTQYGATLDAMCAHIEENPRVSNGGTDKTIIEALPYQSILNWIEAKAPLCRVLFVDPVSQIDFSGRNLPEEQSRFLRQAAAIASDSGATILLVCHTIKRPGAAGKLLPTVEDIQGSAQFGRLCHTILLLDAHELKESTVQYGGSDYMTKTVEHDRTVVVGKARNSGGGRKQLAFLQSTTGPSFVEQGIIVSKKREA